MSCNAGHSRWNSVHECEALAINARDLPVYARHFAIYMYARFRPMNARHWPFMQILAHECESLAIYAKSRPCVCETLTIHAGHWLMVSIELLLWFLKYTCQCIHVICYFALCHSVMLCYHILSFHVLLYSSLS